MAEILTTDSTDLAAIFGIEMDAGSSDCTAEATRILTTATCQKCSGTGQWIGGYGRKRIVRACFGCDGTGVDRRAFVEVKASASCALASAAMAQALIAERLSR